MSRQLRPPTVKGPAIHESLTCREEVHVHLPGPTCVAYTSSTKLPPHHKSGKRGNKVARPGHPRVTEVPGGRAEARSGSSAAHPCNIVARMGDRASHKHQAAKLTKLHRPSLPRYTEVPGGRAEHKPGPKCVAQHPCNPLDPRDREG